VLISDGDELDTMFEHIGRNGRTHVAVWLTHKA